MKAILAVDVGTSSVRAALFDEQLNLLNAASRTYALEAPAPGWAEQDPAAIFQGFDEAMAECLRQRAPGVEVTGICLDTAMHSLVALNRDAQAMTNVWTWADTRATGILSQLAEEANAMDLHRRTGCPLHAMYFPGKIRWMRENMPDVFERAASFASIKGLLLHRLTGRLVEDSAIASGSGLLNLASLEWDERALAFTGIDRDRLPDVIEPRAIAGVLRSELAERWGVPAVPVVAGGSDGPMANVGAGCVREGDMAITVGTSSAVRMFISEPRIDPTGRTWTYYLGDETWVVGGAINAGGGTLDWFRRSFPLPIPDGVSAHAHLDAMAGAVPPGSDGLILAPYLSGERNPGLQGDARGFAAGLSLRHSAAHFVRALMEGVVFQIAWAYEAVTETAQRPERIRITGGFVDSTTWPQMLADALGQRLEAPTNKEGSLVGVAAFGLSAVSERSDWRSLVGQIQAERRIDPDDERHRRYQDAFALYKELYGAMRPHFTRVADLQRE